jgi:hypothetical protein
MSTPITFVPPLTAPSSSSCSELVVSYDHLHGNKQTSSSSALTDDVSASGSSSSSPPLLSVSVLPNASPTQLVVVGEDKVSLFEEVESARRGKKSSLQVQYTIH